MGRAPTCRNHPSLVLTWVRYPKEAKELMGFWLDVLSSFIANIAAAVLIVVVYIAVQWFLGVTDITIGYAWKSRNSPRGLDLWQSFDIRIHSRSRTYFLANIAYINGENPVAPCDNKSVWGKELKPGTIHSLEAAPVAELVSLKDCTGVEVHVRLQNGRLFWLKGQGPGQLHMGGIQRAAFWLRYKLERTAVPLE